MNVAMAAATQWVFNFVVARCFLSMTQNMGYQFVPPHPYSQFYSLANFNFQGQRSLFLFRNLLLLNVRRETPLDLPPFLSSYLPTPNGERKGIKRLTFTSLPRFFFVWFLVPETKGMSLERMDDLFGVTELVKNIEADETAAATTTTTIHERDAEKTAAPTQTRVEHV